MAPSQVVRVYSLTHNCKIKSLKRLVYSPSGIGVKIRSHEYQYRLAIHSLMAAGDRRPLEVGESEKILELLFNSNEISKSVSMICIKS